MPRQSWKIGCVYKTLFANSVTLMVFIMYFWSYIVPLQCDRIAEEKGAGYTRPGDTMTEELAEERFCLDSAVRGFHSNKDS